MIINLLATIGVISLVVFLYNKQQERKTEHFLDLKEFRESKVLELIESVYQACYITAWKDWIKEVDELGEVKQQDNSEEIGKKDRMINFHKIRQEELTKIRNILVNSVISGSQDSSLWKDEENTKSSDFIKVALKQEFSRSILAAQEKAF